MRPKLPTRVGAWGVFDGRWGLCVVPASAYETMSEQIGDAERSAFANAR